MNKTVNINLAGIFFHIDEDAYLKLQRYLEAIKRSFTDSQGRSEIIADIEARIAELFNERVKNDKQVIRIKEVDEVISIMGQPEDYLVDDEIFEDEPKTTYSRKSTSSRKLFRDTDNSYVGGVSSGLAHYFGIDVIWIRLAWILLIFGAGTGILLYILLWILVPEAKTTSEKIMMTGEPVNISNIEKKIKDGFDSVSDVAKEVTDSVSNVAKNVGDSVSDAVSNIDFKKKGSSIKSSSKTFFDTLADVIMFFFKVFAKFIGIILIIVGASTLIGLIIGLFSVGVADIIHIPGLDMVDIVNAGNTPIWLVSLLSFFAVGIPFFFLFYLGLKILINNLKSIGNIAKFTLLGLWLISIIALIVVGIRQASEFAYDESYIEKTELPITATDTLNIKMISNDNFNPNFYRNNHGFKLAHDDDGNKTIYSSDVDIRVRSTTDSVATIAIEKSSDGRSYEIARERAKNINYNFALRDNTLLLDSYLTTNPENKFSDQEVDVILYIPENTVVYFNNSTKSFLYYKQYEGNIISREDTNHYMKILFDDAECLDCPEEDFEVKVNTPGIKINDEGLEIKSDDGSLKIDEQGIKAESEDVKVNIDSNGINIESDN
ncbi:PspC domain-containing protein [Flaviramulus sp. BrNp1-15]|uniref:PspC domain-containing protein n=1 Tax=Flaviramulus sp. BrNp1-15 TaxID=2916754 RepID=UPI001EE83E54|nr:PspC domain-containing protein [Flaviramulus sp. BrNp1-15]ULC59119.1 PspC domain-containing protein [Flaviramulus sp. BrNp1-15]